MAGILQGVLASIGAAKPVYIEDVYSTTLYTGNATPRSIVNGIDLAGNGGLVWTKSRNSASFYNNLYDTARGATNALASNVTTGTVTSAQSLTAFNSNGFSLGTDADGFGVNVNGITFASWTFREQPKFFDIVTYTGNGASGARNIAHNLKSLPRMIIVKRLDSTSNWMVAQLDVELTQGGNPVSEYFNLNNTNAAAYTGVTNAGPWSFGSNDSVFTIFNGANINGATYVAYLFASNDGGFGLSGNENVISSGTYTGNGSSTGPTINVGYEPQWLLLKRATGGTGDWALVDTARGFTASTNVSLEPNSAAAESTATNIVGLRSTGFQLLTSDPEYNENGSTYMYMTIRKGPMA